MAFGVKAGPVELAGSACKHHKRSTDIHGLGRWSGWVRPNKPNLKFRSTPPRSALMTPQQRNTPKSLN